MKQSSFSEAGAERFAHLITESPALKYVDLLDQIGDFRVYLEIEPIVPGKSQRKIEIFNADTCEKVSEIVTTKQNLPELMQDEGRY